MTHQQTNSNSLVVSYLFMRKAIGCLGIALPFVLALGAMAVDGTELQSSMSAYYFTVMGDVFVGVLCAIGVFLLAYKGHGPVDDLAGTLACVFAVGVALFPTVHGDSPSEQEQLIGYIHIGCAAAFLLTLACFSLFLFTKSAPGATPTAKKRQRNAVYVICGCIILLALGVLGLLAFLEHPAVGQIKSLNGVFWLESAAVVAFGVSWFVKGETILKDES